MVNDRFIVKSVSANVGIPRAKHVMEALDDEEIEGYDLKFVQPVADGGGYTSYIMLIFERKENAPSIDPE